MEIKLKENSSFIVKDSTGDNAFTVEEAPKGFKTTWAELKAARDAGKLSPGLSYRITDYQCSTSTPYTKAVNNTPFDIVVTAIDESNLNENAFATTHENNLPIFSWKLKYCLDNDTDRFDWALNSYICASYNQGSSRYIYHYDTKISTIASYPHRWRYGRGTSGSPIKYVYTESENPSITDKVYTSSSGGTEEQVFGVSLDKGKGVVYNMIDQYGNDCPYDFKNIMFLNTTLVDINFSGNYCHYFAYYAGTEIRNQNTYYKYTCEIKNTNKKIHLYFLSLNPTKNTSASIAEFEGDWSSWSGPTYTTPSSYKIWEYKLTPKSSIGEYLFTFGSTDYSTYSVRCTMNKIDPCPRNAFGNSNNGMLYLPFNLFYLRGEQYTGGLTYNNKILGQGNIIENTIESHNINIIGNTNYIKNCKEIFIKGNLNDLNCVSDSILNSTYSINISNYAKNINIQPGCSDIIFTSSSTWNYQNLLQNILVHSGVNNVTLDINTNNSFLTEIKPNNSVIKLV